MKKQPTFIGVIVMILISNFFLPTMILNGSSLGCRFQSIRLAAIMVNYHAKLFCVLHPLEIGMYIVSLMILSLHAINQWQEVNILNVEQGFPLITSIILLIIPFIDLTILGIYTGAFQYGIIYQISWGYIVYAIAMGFLCYILYKRNTGNYNEVNTE